MQILQSLHRYFKKERVLSKIQKLGFLAGVILISSGCNSAKNESYEKAFDSDSTSNVISIDTTNIPYAVTFKKEVVFESNDEVFFEGYIWKIAVGDNGRTYIVASKPGAVGIYVFEPDGRFITKLGDEGRGPGEVEAIGSISINDNKLYVFGPRLQKFVVFSLDDYQLIRDQVIRRDSIPKSDTLANILRVNELQVVESGAILARMSNLTFSKENEIAKIRYHKVSEEGNILPGRIVELKKFHFYFGKNEPYPILMPFSRTTLVSISGRGSIYAAWSDAFLIKKFDIKGNYLKSFQMPFNRTPLKVSGLDLNDTQKRILWEYEIPQTWQALNTIEADDEGRLWVSTVTESDSTFKWWVINEEGKVLATFTRPGQRSEIPVMSKPFYKINNGYFYEPERDTYGGIIRIVKYKIEFIERP